MVVDGKVRLVNPGVNPSPHMHQIVGGDAFNVTMDPRTDIAEMASCTTCTFSEDFSNYWTAVLYFRARNGTFKRVQQLSNQNLADADGGMTVYYVSPDSRTSQITAFRPGFRMLAGTAEARIPQSGFVNLYRCYDGYDDKMFFYPNPMGVAASDTTDLPKGYCAGGIRVNTFFPTCWDGINLDSPDHKTHVAYPVRGQPCPATHPVEIPQIFIETIWKTGDFPKEDWPEDGSQPFVFSQGDPTGFGHHADYVFGWKGDSLQKAMDARCDVYDPTPDGAIHPPSECPQLRTQEQVTANKCVQRQMAREELDEWISELPGGRVVTYA
ncbi:hypothetical protein GLAREA_08508 [Glarea lozoyensis ATCC 20868]|uniref:DUF1996 domain-containing protein n=1 Tax=Glarea lozoyensis (strain ATCC 20868 / MF5171) TaxID=1116229 RepID=S3CFA9_GLAL2|nr:uncharacterized protein GLAREA_08508 [Glarea lozoyensis ATCC 20868]EPE24655.1 hypothetical protein GLAREA_08508 [Glarea lozoyensis ATCC 20868]